MLDLSSISPGFNSELQGFDTLLGTGMNTPPLVSTPPTGSSTNAVSNAVNNVSNAVSNPVSTAGSFLFGLVIGRAIAIILGIIFIIAGLFMFKSGPGPVIIDTAKKAVKGAAEGAVEA